MAMQGDSEDKAPAPPRAAGAPERMDALVAAPCCRMRPGHPRRGARCRRAPGYRRFVPSASFWLLLAAGFSWRFGALAAPLLLGVPWAAFAARRWVAHAGYADGATAWSRVREGWIDRRWRFAEVGKLQGCRLERNTRSIAALAAPPSRC
jgi:putative membrane protein